jgi:hypothetical protein
MTNDLERARAAVAREIGPDVAEFTPAGEKHFIAEAALLAMGGTFLYAFFKGMVEKTGESLGKEVGEPLGKALGSFFGGIFKGLGKKESAVPDKELESAQAEAAAAVKSSGLTQEQINQIAQAVALSMATVLSQDADVGVSNRVAQRVKTEGLKVIADGER